MKDYKKLSYLSPDDVDVFKLLIRQRAINALEIQTLFAKRGILISSKTPRDKLANYYSSFMLFKPDYNLLDAFASVNPKRDPSTSMVMDKKLNSAQMNKLKTGIIEELTELDVNIADCVVVPGETANHKEIRVSYIVQDTSKSFFGMNVRHEAVIVINSDSKGTHIDIPSLEIFRPLLKEKVPAILNKLLKDEPIKTIDLSFIERSEDKVRFFNDLLNGISGLAAIEVNKVGFHVPDSDMDEKELHGGSLSGRNLMTDKDVQRFLRGGYHLYKLSWSVEDSKFSLGDNYGLEVVFNGEKRNDIFVINIKNWYEKIGNKLKLQPSNKIPQSRVNELKKIIFDAAYVLMVQYKSLFENASGGKQIIDEENEDGQS